MDVEFLLPSLDPFSSLIYELLVASITNGSVGTRHGEMCFKTA